jgi:predicted ester cyclase
MNLGRPHPTVRAYLDLLAARNIDAISKVFAPGADLSFTEQDLEGQSKRKGDAARHAETLWRAFGPPTIELLMAVNDREEVAARWSAKGRHDGPFLGVAATGVAVRWSAGGVGRVDNSGRLCSWVEIWDVLSVLVQVGAADLQHYPGF